MAKFLYTAKSYDGKTKGGEIVAKTEQSAVAQIKAEGFLVTSIQESKDQEKGIKTKMNFNLFSVPLKEKMIFARNLAVMVESGLSIGKALDNLSVQVQNKTFKGILAKMYKDIQAGKSLSESMAEHPNAFDDLFVNMVRVGEIGGNLEEVLTIVAIQLEKESALRSKVKGAMMYPAVIVVAMSGVGVLMLTYILPKITGVFADMDVELPASTQFIVDASDLLRNNLVAIAIAVVVGGIFLKIFLGTVPGKKTLSFLVLNAPITKNIVIKVNCARFSRIYSSLLKSGVSVLDALDIISNTLSNYEYKSVLAKASEDIQKGVSLSSIINSNKKIFPPLVGQMAEVGEETGKSESMFLKLAEFYEEEVNQITKNLSSVIEPVLMVVMGSAVGFFAVAMLQPMYGLMENIN
ncbi:MAG: type II secretion system F family protein [Candidatus Moranbacteria bacterium]|nr:type II secretion system F family protein [Candidatus Moranbacteria bacterium]